MSHNFRMFMQNRPLILCLSKLHYTHKCLTFFQSPCIYLFASRIITSALDAHWSKEYSQKMAVYFKYQYSYCFRKFVSDEHTFGIKEQRLLIIKKESLILFNIKTISILLSINFRFCLCLGMCWCVCVCMYVFVCMYVCVCVGLCICVCVCMCVCMYVCICV